MSRTRSRIAALALVVLSVLVLAAIAVARAPADDAPIWPPLPGKTVWSLLAVGDTGTKPAPFLRSRQVISRVSRAMAAEDVRRPADALVLLGDNFYPDGLRLEELDERVRVNLIEPFCRFLPSPTFRCPVPARPARVLAVLGNHDHHAAESPRLERTEIARRLPFFFMPAGPVHTMDLGRGVSIVLYDPRELLQAGSFEPLREAIRQATGPWRILASHYPLTRRESDLAGRAARELIAGQGVPVHVHLAGHRHYLELAHGEAPPFLQAIAGSGSSTRLPKEPVDGSVYQAELPGFARVDLVDGAGGERLVVSLVAVPGGVVFGGSRPHVVARWSVGRDGDTRAEPLAE